MNAHLKEPWSFAPDIEDGPSMDWNVFDASGALVCVTCEEDARRIAASVNACSGIPNEYLEDTENWESAGVMAVSLMVKRCDELLSACKEALESGEDGDWQSARKVLALAITNRNK